MKKVVLGSVILLKEDDKYHDWILFDMARRKKLPIKDVVIEKNRLAKLKYTNILEKKEILKLKSESKENKDIINLMNHIKKINRRQRIIVIPVNNKKAKEAVEKAFPKEVLITFPSLKEYKDKEKVVNNLINKWKMEFKTVETRKTLVRNMIRDVNTWEDVLLFSENLNYQRKKMTNNDIDELFPDSFYYNLDAFIYKVLEGKIKQKTTKIAFYYMETRGYSPKWLLNKIREEANLISVFYQAYRGGVLLIPENKKRLSQRIMDLNWPEGLILADKEEYEQRRYLEYIEKLPYRYFLRILPILYETTSYVYEKDVYYIIEKLRREREDFEHGDSNGK